MVSLVMLYLSDTKAAFSGRAKNASSRPRRTELNNRADYLNKRGSSQFPPHRTRVLFYHQFD